MPRQPLSQVADRAGWRTVVLGDVAEITLGRTPSRNRSEYWKDGDVPWVSIGDLNGGEVRQTEEKISQRAHQEVFGGRIVPAGTLLLSFKLTIGKAGILTTPAVHNEAIASFTLLDSSVDRDFLFYLLQVLDYSPYLDAYVKGKTLNKDKLRMLKLVMPSKDEQVAIAKALNVIRKALAAERALVGASRELRRTLMHHLLTYGPVSVSASDRVELRNTEIGAVPSAWRLLRLSEFARTASGGTPDRSRPDFYGGPIAWVKSGELRDGLVASTEESLTQAGLENSSAKTFAPGTLLVAMYGATAGKVALLGIEACTNQAICAIFPDPQIVYPQYLFYALTWRRDALLGERYGGAQPNISQAVLRNFHVPVPPLDEQVRIAEMLAAIDRKIATAEARVNQLRGLFDGAIRGLTSGAIRLRSAGTHG